MQHEPYIHVVPGSRMAVLMIHGIAGTPRHFQPLLSVIPDDWSVYNILLDGHGKQAADFAATSMDKWNAQVQAQLSAILAQHRKVLIVAHSMGSLFAIQSAIRQPEAVAGLFLLGVPLSVHLPPATAFAAIQMALGLARPGTRAQAMLDDCGVHPTPWLWRYLGWIPRFWELLMEIRSTRPLLSQLAVPCRSYQSRKDELVSMRSCRYLENHPCIVNTVLMDSGHFGYTPEDIHLLQMELRQMISQL